MKNMLKKFFYWDAPAHGALFGTSLFLLGGWILFLQPLFSAIVEKYGILYWIIGGILTALFMVYMLICGIHFGVLYKNELSFTRRWKWQIPATFCWIILGFIAGVILKKSASPDFITDRSMIYVRLAGTLTIFAGILFCARIIEKAALIPWNKLFGKGILALLILSVVCNILIAAACK